MSMSMSESMCLHWFMVPMRVQFWRSGLLPNLTLDKPTPNLIRLPNRVQVALGFQWGTLVMKDSVKKYENGHALIGGAMDKHAPTRQRLHHPAESLKIL